MLRQDRFLIGILVGLAVLAGAAIVAVVVRTPFADYMDDSTPSGVVHNYLVALQRGEPDRAYVYLTDRPGRPTQADFLTSHAVTRAPASRASFQIGEANTHDGEASVGVTVSTGYGGLLFLDPSGYVYYTSAHLVQENGEWRLIEMPGEWWDYSWYDQFPPPDLPSPAY